MVLNSALELYNQPGRSVEGDCLIGLSGIIRHMYPNTINFADNMARERVTLRLNLYRTEEVEDRYSAMLTNLYV